MYKFMLKNKRGFTLVELMIVIVLMGFGVVALANLFQSGYRTFSKSSERYAKQEAVKSVAEYLQGSIRIGAATKVEIYPDSSVVPTVAGADTSFAYIYVEKADKDGDGVIDGYYLYKLERGQKKSDAVCLNEDVPLYITFSVYRDYDFVGDVEERNQCGIKVNIAAVDNDYEYKTAEELESLNVTEAEDIADYIYFSMPVSYHFPNMVNATEQMRVNYTNNIKDRANTYNESGLTGETVEALDINGQVLRVTMDTTISTDEANSAVTVSSFCFIATAGYGEATGEVGLLCDFRDECLLTNPLGRMFVKVYYTISPPIAEFISQSEPLKAVVRVALKPLVSIAVYALEPDLLIDQLPFIIMGVGSFVGLVVVGVRSHKKRKLIEE